MRKTVSNTWVLFANEMALSVRQIAFVAVTITLPLFYLFLFGPLLKSVAATNTAFPPGGAYNVFVPGLLVQLGLFGTAYVGFSIIARMRMGVLERMRATQASRFAVVFGAVLKEDVTLVAQSVIVVLLAIPLGVHLNPAGTVLTLVLIAVLGCMFASISWAVALTLRSEDSLAGILNTIAMPLLLLSGILLPMSLAPRWLRWISNVNPLHYTVDAARALFNDHITTLDAARGSAVTVALTILAVTWAVRAFAHSEN